MRTGASHASAWPRPARPRLGGWLLYRDEGLWAQPGERAPLPIAGSPAAGGPAPMMAGQR